jgi:hypothetical protein
VDRLPIAALYQAVETLPLERPDNIARLLGDQCDWTPTERAEATRRISDIQRARWMHLLSLRMAIPIERTPAAMDAFFARIELESQQASDMLYRRFTQPPQ